MRNNKLVINLAGWIGLVMAIIIGGAISPALAMPVGVGWIFLCLFDPKGGKWR